MGSGQSKPVVGIVGGIGAGKTCVTRILAERGCRVVSADEVNSQILTQKRIIEILVGWWGTEILTADGRVERAKIADIVFSDPQQRRRLESLTHPLIEQQRAAMICDSIKDQAVKAIVLDSPLLLECNLDQQCDAVVFVEADEAVRLQRLARSRGWGEAELKRRELQQMPLEQKRARAQYVIRNSGSAADLAVQVENVLNQILEQFRKDSDN